jgi:hypothetical protein
MKWLSLLAVISFAACGGSTSSSSPSTPQGATMQAGQWEFVATPSSSTPPVYIETNLTLSHDQVTSGVFSTLLFKFGGVGGLFSICQNYELNSTVVNGTLGGMSTPDVGVLESPGSGGVEANFTATIASNGQSVSSGSYTDTNGFCLWEPVNTSGTFTGYAVTPLNGTFSGMLTGGVQSQQVTLQITQDSNFGITASGTSVQPGLTTTLAIFPAASGGYSNVIGATVQASGTATNVNGSSTIQVAGHINPAGTQIQVSFGDQAGTETGTLTKQ